MMPHRTPRLQLQELTERINPVAGAVDLLFSGDGIALTPVGQMPIDRSNGMALQEDGKILVAGDNLGVPMIARFNSNGTLDTSFSSDGMAYLTNYGDNATLYDIGIQSTGDIVVCGTTRVGGNYMILAARLTTEGNLDPLFGPNGNGIAMTDLSLSDDNGFALAVQSNDKIVVVGNNTNSQLAMVRYNAHGLLDTSFGGIGSITISGSSHATGVAVYNDGRILASGANGSGVFLTRVGPTGILDSTFDGDGMVVTNLPGIGSEETRNVTLDANENILVAATGSLSSRTHGIIMRYLDNGTLDPTFDGDGYTVVDFQNSGGAFNTLTVDHNGLILGAGGVAIPGGSKSLVARFLTNGTLDTSFAPFGGTATPGMAITDMAPGDNDGFGAIAVQADGKIVAAGTAGGGSTRYMGVVRYRSDDRGEPVADSYTLNEDTPHVMAAPGILANDYVPNDVVPDIELITLPTHGTLQLQQDGSFTYTPHLHYHGPDSFQYQLIAHGSSTVATVTFTVVAQPDAPLSQPEAYTTSELTTITRNATTGVLANDSDPDVGSSLTAVLVEGPSVGTLQLQPNGSFTYTFPDDYFGTTTFTYQANDGSLNSAATTVTLTRQDVIRANGSILVVAGTDSADVVRIRSAGGKRVLVELRTPNKFVRQVLEPAPGLSKFTGIEVHLGDGDDLHDSTTLGLPTTVFAGLGNDIVRTGGGKDIFYGDRPDGSGAGDDTLEAGEGQSTISGGGGRNSIRTGKLADTIIVGDGPNKIVTGNGNDTVTAGNGTNEFITEAGNDFITTGSGDNIINGGAGNDTIRTTTGNNFIDAGAGNDDVRVQGGNNTILGDKGNDVLVGGSGNDVIDGGAGKDLLVGGLGADLLNGDSGDDMLFDGTVVLTTPATDSFAKLIAAYKPKNKPATVALLQRFTVTTDGDAVDSLVGSLGTDWFWFSAPNEAFDMISIEPRNNLI